MFPVEIRVLAATRVAAVPHVGPYPQIGAAFSRLWALLTSSGLVNRITGPGIALYHDDPATTPAGALRSHAGVTVAPDGPLPEGFDDIALPAGRAAVLTYKGPYTGLQAPWSFLFGPWLSASGEAPSDHPAYEVYLNDPMQTTPENLLTEIVLPLR